jgi:ribosomal protein S18 acetylase RimI-like enzyme
MAGTPSRQEEANVVQPRSKPASKSKKKPRSAVVSATRARKPARPAPKASRPVKVAVPARGAGARGAPAPAAGIRIRRLSPKDLDAVVAIDAAIMGRSRRAYHERRLRIAIQEPELHVQFAAEGPQGLLGFLLARRLHGQFGRPAPSFRLEMLAVSTAGRGHGVGRQLMQALEDEAKKRGLREIRTSASWTRHEMLRFLDHAGFQLGRNLIVDCAVHGGKIADPRTEGVATPERESWSNEIDYGAENQNDYEALARDHADVRTLQAEDLPDIVRIDRRTSGQQREEYVKLLVNEALNDSAVRVSLTARVDGIVAGFVAASTDFGDFGRTEPVAVLDTIGVDPDYAHHGIGHALLSQLFVNLQALRVERVETVVSSHNFALLGFLYDAGFEQAQRLGFVKTLA